MYSFNDAQSIDDRLRCSNDGGPSLSDLWVFILVLTLSSQHWTDVPLLPERLRGNALHAAIY